MEMKKLCLITRGSVRFCRVALASQMRLFLAAPAFAQSGNSPWENAVNVLQQAFTSTIARRISLVAIVFFGITFAFGPIRVPSQIPWTLSYTLGDRQGARSLKSLKSDAMILTLICSSATPCSIDRRSSHDYI
jgi:type IV secretory pathway VirB2 component (pilin)